MSTATTGHQEQNIMNIQTSTPLESITTKGAIFRDLAADMEDRKYSSRTTLSLSWVEAC